ncbi:hypothetical protein EPN95_04660 [Patescibacteria group bacterium]|nr:MAG: hypothetical protein EPN95_04660 [Patescibacteria group bacterium]
MGATEDFLGLPQEEQHKVLSNLNQDYKGLPPEEQHKVINSMREGSLQVGSLFEAGEIPEGQPEYTTAQSIYLKTKPFVKPAAEAAALIGGGIVGAGAGLLTPIPGDEPIGAVIGAGLAAGGVKSFFNFIENSLGLREPKSLAGEFKEAGKDIAEGAAAEATGQIGGTLISKGIEKIPEGVKHPIRTIGDKLALTKKGAQTRAIERFEEETAGTALTNPQITRNIETAKSLEAKIPGLKFTQGQLTNDASAISLERTLARKSGQDLSQAQREFANEVLRNHYAAKVSGAGKAGDLAARAEKMSGALQAASIEAEAAVQSEVMRLGRNLDEQAIGRDILTKLSKGKQGLKDQVGELFDRIPNLKVNPAPLGRKIDDVMREILPGEPKADIPTEAIELIRRYINPSGKAIKDIDIKTARGLNRTLNNLIRKAETGLEPNKVLSRRLQILKEGIEESYAATEQAGGQAGIELLKKANALRRELGTRFEKGSVADVLAKGPRGEETRIAMANIAKEFNSLDGIDDLVRATGDRGTAAAAMKDYYSYDLLNSARDPSTGKLVTNKTNAWLAKNMAKLEKLGLLSEFKNTATLQSNAEQAAKTIDVFNKSVAGRILEADTETMILNAFRGSKNYGNTAGELMKMVKGDKAAEAGLKKAVSDHLIKQSETTAVDFFQKGGETVSDIEFTRSVAKLTNQVKKSMPALRVIYQDEPEKIRALMNVLRAYQTLGRTAKSPLGGGSDTFELFGKSLDIVAGAAAPGKWYAFKTVRDMLNRFSEKNVEMYLRRAMFDPDYAETLRFATQGITPERVTRINHLMTLIAYGVGEQVEESSLSKFPLPESEIEKLRGR